MMASFRNPAKFLLASASVSLPCHFLKPYASALMNSATRGVALIGVLLLILSSALRATAARQPDVVKQLSTAYDQWWADVLPYRVNEDAYKTAPNINPFKQDYSNQFGGVPQPSNHDN